MAAYPLPVLIVLAASACLLGGCGVERLSGLIGTSSEPPAATASGETPPAEAARQVPPPVDMGGKWTLAAPGSGSCVMTFGATPGASEGTIAPAGGCPFSFFTSRKWTYEDAGLMIRDHTGLTLARLAQADSGGFHGQTVASQTVTLTR
jgi:hypothetical protein